jgi:hypothetical protein
MFRNRPRQPSTENVTQVEHVSPSITLVSHVCLLMYLTSRHSSPPACWFQLPRLLLEVAIEDAQFRSA